MVTGREEGDRLEKSAVLVVQEELLWKLPGRIVGVQRIIIIIIIYSNFLSKKNAFIMKFRGNSYFISRVPKWGI